jgi:DNA-binding MarR family transcriptional regulator
MPALRDQDYQLLAEFRHSLRQFLAFSEAAAKDHGLTPTQHQAILAIKGSASGQPTIGDLADMLLVKPHTALELADRLIAAGYLEKAHAEDDRRRVLLSLTGKAEALLYELSTAHLDELRRGAPLLLKLLDRLKQEGR